ncbi:flagellar export chaperone FliS [Pelagicoccus sp. SDUM812003]|uniref:flagellar export chaperone FliS n=1 Tax=Pelagicoccus sp. SDUM812003 TaxID=3041267 RepID=UPI0028103C8B|nr:flagellar export chaperone FliS [Pelagicoccus sp. SDUM812003]MDQ8201539.1 flagellar export chaperone FliS [Pelagicoccus sp. SDUM812003]
MKSNAASYKRAAILSASPERLILMLFDGALDAMRRSLEGFQISDFKKRNEIISNNLIKAQNIFVELQGSLRMDKGGEFAERMYALYDFYNQKLNEANFNKKKEPIQIVIKLVTDVRDAWAEMLTKQAPKARPAPAPAAYGSTSVGGGLSLRA